MFLADNHGGKENTIRFSNMMPLERLERVGFQKIGGWTLVSNEPRFSLDSLGKTKNILYAFVIGNVPVYIGKTTTQLRQRLYGYQRPGPTQQTNKRANELLKGVLRSEEVSIYALPDNGLLYFGGFHLNLAAALEASVIKELQPKWNVHGLMPTEV
jgi:hypothetical protein